MQGKRRVLVLFGMRDPARQPEAATQADKKCPLAAREVTDHRAEQHWCRHIYIPEANLPGIVEASWDIGRVVHGPDSHHRAHDRARDHQADRCENRQAYVKQHRPKVAQRG